jgi:hypothetical protein
MRLLAKQSEGSVGFLTFNPGQRGMHHYFTDEALKEPTGICLPARMTPDVLLAVPSADAVSKVKQILAQTP